MKPSTSAAPGRALQKMHHRRSLVIRVPVALWRIVSKRYWEWVLYQEIPLGAFFTLPLFVAVGLCKLFAYAAASTAKAAASTAKAFMEELDN